MADGKKKQFRRAVDVEEDDDDDAGPVLSRSKAAAPMLAAGKPRGSVGAVAGGVSARSNLRELDDDAPVQIRMQASGTRAAVPAPAPAVEAGGEYSSERLRALRASQHFRLSVATDSTPSEADSASLQAGALTLAPSLPSETLVAVVEGGDAADVDAASEARIKQAAALAKAKREQARRTGGGIAPDVGADPDDYVPLRLRSKGQASGGVEAGGALPRGAVPHGLALAGDEDSDAVAEALMPSASRLLPTGGVAPAAPASAVGIPSHHLLHAHPQQLQQHAGLSRGLQSAVAPASDPAATIRALRATLVGAASQARAAAEAAEREVARIAVEVQEATAAATAARSATLATAAPTYDWYAGLRAYGEELVACLREKAGGVRALETAADDLEAALTLKRARRRAADLADEVFELTDASAAASAAAQESTRPAQVTLVGCGGALEARHADDPGAVAGRRDRRHARRAKIAAPLRRFSRALAAGRAVSAADLEALCDGDTSDTEVARAVEKRGDLAAAARLLLSDVDGRYASVGAVLERFRPWKTHATYAKAYANTLACISLGELLAVLVRADLVTSWRLFGPPPPTAAAGQKADADAAADLRPMAGGLGWDATASAAGVADTSRSPPQDPLLDAVSAALRGGGGSEDAGTTALDAAVAAAGPPLALDQFAWFRSLWDYGEAQLEAGAAAAHPAAQAAEERLLPQVIQASATARLAAHLRHAYDPTSLASTAVAVAALKECLVYEPDATAVTSCVAALAARLQVAVNDAVLPVLVFGGAGEGRWQSVEDGSAGAAAVEGLSLHPLTVLRFLELARLVRSIAAWEFALAPALLRRMIEEQCIGVVAQPLLAATGSAARAAVAGAQQAAGSAEHRLTVAHAALGSVNLHGALLAVLAASLPQSWHPGSSSASGASGGSAVSSGGWCAGLGAAEALSLWQRAAALQVAATAPGADARPLAPPAWCAALEPR